MPVTFYLPGPLRSVAGGHSQVEIPASPATLRDALNVLVEMYPGIRDRVLTEQGQIREHLNVFVGKENCRYTGGLSTPVPEGADVSIIPSVSGG